jgi:hypothetical protein
LVDEKIMERKEKGNKEMRFRKKKKSEMEMELKKVKEENPIVFHNTWHACAGFIKFSKVTWLPTTKAYIGYIWEGS